MNDLLRVFTIPPNYAECLGCTCRVSGLVQIPFPPIGGHRLDAGLATSVSAQAAALRFLASSSLPSRPAHPPSACSRARFRSRLPLTAMLNVHRGDIRNISRVDDRRRQPFHDRSSSASAACTGSPHSPPRAFGDAQLRNGGRGRAGGQGSEGGAGGRVEPGKKRSRQAKSERRSIFRAARWAGSRRSRATLLTVMHGPHQIGV